MQIEHIPLDRLSVAPINMRRGRRKPEIADILPSIRKRGVLSPLFVRPNGKEDHFDILAGKRRYYASIEAAKEEETSRELPCIVLGVSDDAEALEISMIENLLREDPDEVTQWEAFTRLVKEGRDVDEIAASFAISELRVKRILALGDLLPRIREAYRAQDIDAATVRHLTLASKAQQKAWLALFEDEEKHAPRGSQLKAWLFGGTSIATSVALFDLGSYEGQIVSDLFGEDGYFADKDAFWKAQMEAVEARKTAYLEAGWGDVVIVPAIEYFASWEYERRPKSKGGRVYIQLRAQGEVVFHEGFVSRAEAQAAERRARGQEEKPARPELTSTLASYIDLHRHAAVSARLAAEPSVALRVMVAHAIAGSPLWSVRAADLSSRNEKTAASLAASPALAALAEKRRAVLELLNMDTARESVCQDRYGSDCVPILHRLMLLDDARVMQVLALVMAETLSPGSAVIEYLGERLAIDMADHWQADEGFFALLRDKEVLVALLGEVGSEAVASANATQTGPTLKGLIADHLIGANERPVTTRWVPRWMVFPPSAYTERGGVPMVAASRRAKWMIEEKGEAEAAELDDGPQGAALAA
ncbi:MAG: ParB/RepB/Spo0J family partition protein [Erythrobacter sp.]